MGAAAAMFNLRLPITRLARSVGAEAAAAAPLSYTNISKYPDAAEVPRHKLYFYCRQDGLQLPKVRCGSIHENHGKELE